MSAAALRELGVPLGLGRLTVKKIYKLEVFELRSALQAAAKRRIDDKQVWEALLYRTALLREELRPLDLSMTLDALAKARRRDHVVINHLLEEARTKAHKFVPRDTALLMNALAKLGIRDTWLTQSLLPPLLRRTTEKTRWEDLALLSLSCARLGDPCRDALSDRIVEVLTPRLDTCKDGHALSILACAFATPTAPAASNPGLDGETQPLFAQEAHGSGDMHTDVTLKGEINHLAFLEMLLQQCLKEVWTFRAADILHLCLALAHLQQNGHSELFPSKLLRHMEKRTKAIFFDFKPAQLVRFLEVLPALPEFEAKMAGHVLDEAAYQVRDLSAHSCFLVLRAASRFADGRGHLRAQSACAWRLTREEVVSKLPAPQVQEAAILLHKVVRSDAVSVAAGGFIYACREALLLMLHSMQRRRLEPDAAILASLLRIYGELGVRDTHWFHISRRLCRPLTSTATAPAGQVEDSSEVQDDVFVGGVALPASAAAERPSPSPPLSQDLLADAIMGIARLNLPQLIDDASLFSRAAQTVSKSRPAATVLEAAALFDLTERRPQELLGKHLSPLINSLPAIDSPLGDDPLPAPLRLFPFSYIASDVCNSGLLQSWRDHVALTMSSPAEASSSSTSYGDRDAVADRAPIKDEFQMEVDNEMASLQGVDCHSQVAVGPLRAAWAVDLASLARHLARSSSGQASTSEAGPHDADRPRRGRRRSTSAQGRSRTRSALPPDEGDTADASVQEALSDRKADDEFLASVAAAAATAKTKLAASTEDSHCHEPRPESHVLVELLRDRDYYHASSSLKGARQRAKGHVLKAERAAELLLLRRLGWHVVGLPERRWTFADSSADGSELMAASATNQALIFEVISDLNGESLPE
eukprot:TRINITY_DN31706_c0_g1_i1.p1 TRINITY_DN31706_c0_g1~~TRINITY_DN31706_c0_g1_i1.p1  ORF type:complete len:875 (+),score=161.07 TRINITY_DN31706_c0_g1_i1:142-2766(+)